MPLPTPLEITEPFGASAIDPANITLPIPVAAPVDNAAASFELGFPPATMLPIVSGGKPPYGQDMNGILYMISSHTAFLQAGQSYPFSATVAAAIGGYALGSILAMADGSGFWFAITNANSADPDAGGAGWAPLYSYGKAAVTGLNNTNRTLTPAQYAKQIIVLSGALTGNVQVIFPTLSQSWLVVNNCTGAFVITAKTAAGTGVPVPQGGFAAPTGVYCDGTNLNLSVAPLAVPIDQAANPLTLVERTNGGYVLATYFNQSSAIENPTIGAIFVQASTNDGYLRKITPTNLITQLGLVTNASLAATLASYATTAAMNAALALKANLASPALTGAPTAPTAATADSTTKLATTAFVKAAIAAMGSINQTAQGHAVIPLAGLNLILNWGTHTSSTSGLEAITYDMAFPTACVALVATSCQPQHTVSTQLPSFSLTGNQIANGVAVSTTSWLAIGY